MVPPLLAVQLGFTSTQWAIIWLLTPAISIVLTYFSQLPTLFSRLPTSSHPALYVKLAGIFFPFF